MIAPNRRAQAPPRTQRDELSDRRRKPAAWVQAMFAARFAQGLRVVECACGSGYASWLLSRGGAASVIGVDPDPASLAHARKHFTAPGLEFREGSLLSLPLHSASADLAVSLETIEHVRDAAAFVAEVARVLVPGGTLLLSTPLTRGAGRLHPADPFHVREYDPDELAELLAPRFQIVERLGLHSREARAPAPAGAARGPVAALRAGARGAIPGALRTLARALTPGRPLEPLSSISSEGWTDARLQLVVARVPEGPARGL